MNKTIAVRTEAVRSEVRKLTASKPVAAAAGASVLASAALRELPALIARWRTEMPVYMTTARTKAIQEYDKLAVQGGRVLAAKADGKDGSAKS
jgi:hypothetical protein